MAPMMIDDHPENLPRPVTSDSSPLIISTATLNEVSTLVDIEFRAFCHEHVNHVLSFRDYSKPAHIERTRKAYSLLLTDLTIKALNASSKTTRNRADSGYDASNRDFAPEKGATQSSVKFWTVSDSTTGEVISFAKTEMKAYTHEELHSPEDIGHQDDPVMNRDWFALNERVRRQFVGVEKHYYIAMLATKPEVQNKGAGTMLLNAILADADKNGVPVYLEATNSARPLYEKHGFVALQTIEFDPADYGVNGLGVERQTAMVRGELQTTG